MQDRKTPRNTRRSSTPALTPALTPTTKDDGRNGVNAYAYSLIFYSYFSALPGVEKIPFHN
jgi:hypothetical protein